MNSNLGKFVLLAVFALTAVAQTPPLPAAPLRTGPELEHLLAPIALYPDALIALILPAATDPSDVTLAARFLAAGDDPDESDDQPWDDSLKALAHYPDVVKWMDANLQWTQQVGEAFLNQPADVMNAIQRLRAAARAAGILADTPQQQVIVADDDISIVPAEPDVLYVPEYNPDAVFFGQPGIARGTYLTFSIGYPTGFWLCYDVDWWHHRVWLIDADEREHYWRERRDWRHPTFPGRPGFVHDINRHPWHPAPRSNPTPRADLFRPVPPSPAIVRPNPFARGDRPPQFHRADTPRSQPDNRTTRPPADRHEPDRVGRPDVRPQSPPATAMPTEPGRWLDRPQPPAVVPVVPPSASPPAPDRHERREPRPEDRREPESPRAIAPPKPPAIAPTRQPAPPPRQVPPPVRKDQDDGQDDKRDQKKGREMER